MQPRVHIRRERGKWPLDLAKLTNFGAVVEATDTLAEAKRRMEKDFWFQIVSMLLPSWIVQNNKENENRNKLQIRCNERTSVILTTPTKRKTHLAVARKGKSTGGRGALDGWQRKVCVCSSREKKSGHWPSRTRSGWKVLQGSRAALDAECLWSLRPQSGWSWTCIHNELLKGWPMARPLYILWHLNMDGHPCLDAPYLLNESSFLLLSKLHSTWDNRTSLHGLLIPRDINRLHIS